MRQILAVVLLGSLLAHAVPFSQRDLVGLFNSDSDLDPDFDSPPELILSSISTTSIRTRITAHKSHDGTSTGTSPAITQPASTTTTEIITALVTTPALTWTMSTVPAPELGQTPIVPEGTTTSAEEATQWKVIGIGIITIGLIATVILSIIFFDSWWNFVYDLVCGRGRKRRRNQGQEDMVPNWETRDWEFKVANEEGHRYPTMSSLADIAEAQGRKDISITPLPSAAMLSPKLGLLLNLDLTKNVSRETLGRKPSNAC